MRLYRPIFPTSGPLFHASRTTRIPPSPTRYICFRTSSIFSMPDCTACWYFYVNQVTFILHFNRPIGKVWPRLSESWEVFQRQLRQRADDLSGTGTIIHFVILRGGARCGSPEFPHTRPRCGCRRYVMLACLDHDFLPSLPAYAPGKALPRWESAQRGGHEAKLGVRAYGWKRGITEPRPFQR